MQVPRGPRQDEKNVIQDDGDRARDEARRSLAVQQSHVVERAGGSAQGEAARAKYEARRLLALGMYKDTIERAQAAIRLSSDSEEQAVLWHIAGTAACHQRDAALVNTAAKKLAAKPQLVERIATECAQCGVQRNSAGVFLVIVQRP